MANNEHINKVVKSTGETLIDLTGDTVTAGTLLQDVTAHDRSGAQIVGTFVPVTGVKGNNEYSYRTGNVNLTPANIGAAPLTSSSTIDFVGEGISLKKPGENNASFTVRTQTVSGVRENWLTVDAPNSNGARGVFIHAGNTATTIGVACQNAETLEDYGVHFEFDSDIFYGGVLKSSSITHDDNHFKFNLDCAGDSIGRAANGGAALSGSTLDLWYEKVRINGKIVETANVWGLEADFENSTFTRLENAVGLNGGSDFDKFKPWQRRRCNLADDGTVNAYYGDSEYKDDGTNGQVMVEQPVFWYKVEPITLDGVKIRKARYYVADAPVEGFKVHPAFIGLDGTVQDCIYEGAYEGYVSTDKLGSVGGVAPTVSATRANFRTYAENRGTHWRQTNIQIESMDQLLMVIEYGQFNMQDAIGFGNVNASTKLNTGSLRSYGNGTWGDKVNKTYAVQWRGKENMWGNIFKWVDGINLNNYTPYIANSYTYADGTSTNYTSVGFEVAGGNYISAFGYSSTYDWLFLPAECSGSSSVPIGDYADRSSGWRIASFGGVWSNDLDAGPFFWGLNYSSSDSRAYIGGRCAYIM